MKSLVVLMKLTTKNRGTLKIRRKHDAEPKGNVVKDKKRRDGTILDWVREYRQLRRRNLPTEETFQKRQRVLFRISGYVKWRGWTREQLEEALAIVATESVPKLL